MYNGSKNKNKWKNKKRKKYEMRVERIIALNPMGILRKGYGIVSEGRKKIRSIQELELGKKVQIQLVDGSFLAEVKEKYKNEVEK